jgi:hypothetical protein
MSQLRVLFIGLLLGLAAGFSHAAQADTSPDAQAGRLSALEQKLDASLQTIEQLAARVRELEAQLARDKPGPAPFAAPAPDEHEKLARIESDLAQITAANSAASNADHGLAMHGFADVGVGNHNVYDPARRGATVGEIDFYLAPQLGERVKGLAEINIEVDHGTGSVGADLERMQLGYQFGEAATLWVGRFHTPYGYYNTAFHHGLQISTSLRRPKFLAFEDQGGILPAHTTGLWLTGEEHAGDARLRYDLFVGNAQRIVDGALDPQAGGTHDGQVGVGGRLGLRPGGAWSDLQLGISALSTRITSEDDPANVTRLNVAGLYAFYENDNWEHEFEVYFFRNQDLFGITGTHGSTAGFVQFGYRHGLYTPYVRYERTSLDQSDGYFAGQTYGGSYHREALGLRFDLNLKSALKVELAQTHNTDRPPPSYTDLMFQGAVRF